MKAVPVTVTEWKGLNTADDLATFQDGFLKQADNIDIPDSKTLRKRSGFAKLSATQPTGASVRTRILGRHKTSNGDKIYFQTTDGTGAGTALYRCNLDQSSVEQVTIGGGAVTGSLYGYQYNDLFYILRSAFTMLSVTMASPAATSIGSSPSGSQVIAHKGRLWVLDGFGTFGSSVTRIYYSTTALTWGAGDAGNIDIQFGDGKPVVAAVVLSDFLIIFKQDSMWSINADSPDPGDWVVRNLNDKLGCIARDSIQVIDGEVYFLSQRGVYKTDGITPTELSNNIKPSLIENNVIWKPGSFASMLFFASVFYNDRYILFPMAFNTPSEALVYHTRVGGWTRWKFPGIPNNISPFGAIVIEDFKISGNSGFLVGSFNAAGFLYKFVDNQVDRDDGVDMTVTIQTGELVFDVPAQYKRCIETDLDVSPGNTSATVNVNHSFDSQGITSPVSQQTFNSRSIMRFPGPGYFRYMSHVITVTGDVPFELFSITDWMIPKDRVPRAH
jgi:hypothetical protein